MKFKKSSIALIVILLLYTILSFYNLGRNENPQTFVNLKNGEQLIYRIDSENVVLSDLMMYIGNNLSYVTVFLASDYLDYDTYDYDVSHEGDSVFQWNKISINESKKDYSYIVLQSYWDTTVLGEFKAYDVNGNEVVLTPMGDREKILLDEQETVPAEYSLMNSTYFDEVYFPRTAYEQLHDLPIYEYTHPPLGKLIMSIPMKFLGVTPFAYRLMGNIAGIFMILVMYAIAKELFNDEKYGIFAAIIMALDGMHFVQTRIGTVDSFLVLFCLISFLFFVKYLKIKKESKLKEKIIPLLLSGTFWGMAMSVKWTAAFVGLGMGIIYFVDLIWNKKFNFKLILWSILAFVIIPIIIYVVSYIPVISNPNSGITSMSSFFDYQKRMYDYHSNLEADHPFTSKWYTWPIMQKPVWFYSARFENGNVGTISCLGNPAIWWLAIGTTLFTLIYSFLEKDKSGLMLIVMICSTWLTYAFIGRVMFLYHYFITLPFVMLTIVYMIQKLSLWKKNFKYIMPVLSIAFLIVFIYFYPIYSGKPVNPKYIQDTKLLETWFY